MQKQAKDVLTALLKCGFKEVYSSFVERSSTLFSKTVQDEPTASKSSDVTIITDLLGSPVVVYALTTFYKKAV